MGYDKSAGAYSRLGSSCSLSGYSCDSTKPDGDHDVTGGSAQSSTAYSHLPYTAKVILTAREQRAVDELLAFLQHCLARDYLLHVSSPRITSLADYPLKLAPEAKTVHWRTDPMLWYHLQKWLKAKSRGEASVKISIFRFAGEQFEGDMWRYVDRPAEILGLDKEMIRTCIISYSWRFSYRPSKSKVNELVMDRHWRQLAEKVIHDESALNIIFRDVKALSKHTRKQHSLQAEIQSALNKIRSSYFIHLRSEEDFSLSSMAKGATKPWLMDNARGSELQKTAQHDFSVKDLDEALKEEAEVPDRHHEQTQKYRASPGTFQYYEHRLAILEARLERTVILPQSIRPCSGSEVYQEHQYFDKAPANRTVGDGGARAKTGLDEGMQGILQELKDIRKLMQTQKEEEDREKRKSSLR